MKVALLIGAGAGLLVAACGDGGPAPRQDTQQQGLDRQIRPASELPATATNQPRDGTVAPQDDTQGARIGSIVAAQGGQKAQKEKEQRDHAAVQSRREREAAPSAEPPEME